MGEPVSMQSTERGQQWWGFVNRVKDPEQVQGKGKGQRAKGKGQRAKGKGQRAKGSLRLGEFDGPCQREGLWYPDALGVCGVASG